MMDLKEKARAWYLSIWPGAKLYPESPLGARFVAILAALLEEVQNEANGPALKHEYQRGYVDGDAHGRREEQAEVERLTRERDEARAEVARLRAAVHDPATCSVCQGKRHA